MLDVSYTGNVCNRCGRDISKAVKLYGNAAFHVHTESHLRSDMVDYMELAYVFARQLKEEELMVEAHDRLKALDPDMYKKRMED